MNLRTALPSLVLVALTTVIKAADTDSDGLDDSIETNACVRVVMNNTGTNQLVADCNGGSAEFLHCYSIENQQNRHFPVK